MKKEGGRGGTRGNAFDPKILKSKLSQAGRNYAIFKIAEWSE